MVNLRFDYLSKPERMATSGIDRSKFFRASLGTAVGDDLGTSFEGREKRNRNF